MAFAFPSPDYQPCPDCGASVPVGDDGEKHVCNAEQRLDFQVFELRPDIERFSDDFGDWLNTPEGKFRQWLAERER